MRYNGETFIQNIMLSSPLKPTYKERVSKSLYIHGLRIITYNYALHPTFTTAHFIDTNPIVVLSL
jgi:hypothetical protein